MQGKSTLMNQLLGRVRSITGPEPGLTRDAVMDSFTFDGHLIDIVDTAGWLDRGRLKGEALGCALRPARRERRSGSRASCGWPLKLCRPAGATWQRKPRRKPGGPTTRLTSWCWWWTRPLPTLERWA